MDTLPQTSNRDQAANQWAVLAGVRFVLASIVAVSHVTATVDAPDWALGIASLGGFAAVVGFLIISGYSIAASLSKEPLGFYARRLWRIGPVYFACWILAQIPWIVFGPVIQGGIGSVEAPNSLLPVVLNGLCLQTWITPPVATYNPSWSLAVEIACYAVAPFLTRLSTRSLLGIAFISVGAYLLHGRFGHNYLFAEIYGIPFACLAWAWILGFIYHRHQDDGGAKSALIATGVALVQFDPFSSELRNSTTLVLTTLAMTQSRLIPISERVKRLLLWLGEISFPLYMVHYPLLIVLGHYHVKALPALLLAYVAAVAVYYGVDLPFRAYARRGLPSRPRVATI